MSRDARPPRRLAVVIAVPVVAVLLLASLGVHLGVLDPVSEFAADQVRESFSAFTREISGICDAGYTGLLRRGGEPEPRAVRSAQAMTMGEIEDYLRRNGLAGVLIAPGANHRLGGSIPEPVAAGIARGPGRDGPVSVAVGGERFHAATVAFEPWGWRIVVLKSARDYALLVRRVRTVNAVAAVTLLASGALLLLLLNRLVQRPVRGIVEAVGRGERPAATGIAELDALGGGVHAAIGKAREQAASLEREVAERASVEKALRAREAQLATLIDSLPFDLFGIDREGRYFIQNAAGRRLWRDFVGGRPEDFAPDAATLATWLENNRRAFAGETVRGEVAYEIGGGRRHFYNVVAPILVDGRVDGIIGFNIDVTDRKRAEEELARMNKLESVGVLAGGIAHDFNNLLAAILGNIELARLSLHAPGEAGALLAEAERASARAVGLTRQLLTFARGGAPVRRTTVLAGTIRDAAGLALRGSAAGSEIAVAPDLWPVEADEGQIGQVVGNLVLNAVQAMPAGGRVLVAAENTRVAPGDGLPLPPGPFVRITVRDEGPGIPAEALTRIFDPFFTTKERGSGLGLAIAHAVVRSHGGHIAAASPAGGGAAFVVHLPASSRPLPEAPGTREAPPRGAGRVLVMDDDEAVRVTTLRMLGKLGYEAEAAADGDEALARWSAARERGRPFDAVVLDLTVRGGMGGRETLERMRAVDPGVAAIVASGYSDDAVLARHAEHGFRDVLPKPFTVEALAAALHRTVAAPGAGAA